jgi:ATP-dependent Clp protease adaptor protein ClpS
MNNEADRKDDEHSPESESVCIEPWLYRVILHKDDFTPIEFVMEILQKYFYQERRKAAEMTMEVCIKGKTICGMFSKDFAESRVAQVLEYAGAHEYPLHCSMELA